jgi:protein phosphatase 2C family protein 2/3
MNSKIFSEEILNNLNKNQVILGPHRVIPGRLSVSRSFGDIEAKHLKCGGNPKVVTADPDIINFRIDSTMDFIVLGCNRISNQ